MCSGERWHPTIAIPVAGRSVILPDPVVGLAAGGGIALTVAEGILRTIRARYRAGVIEHSLARLQEVKYRAESRGAGEGGDFTGGGASQGGGGQ